MKACPFCAEEIQTQAIKCKHCGESVSPRAKEAKPKAVVESKTTFWPYVLFVLGIAYALLPIDIIPDIPIIGWFDDALVLLTTGINVLEKCFFATNKNLQSITRQLKWIIILLGIVLIVIVALLGSLIIKFFT